MFLLRSLSVLSLLAVLCGCTTPAITNTKRSAVEEILVSTAADRAVKGLTSVPGKSVKTFMDFSNLNCTDSPYVKGAVIQAMGKLGASMVSDKKQAEIIVEVFSGAMGTDFDTFMIGIPPITLPIPFSGPAQTPEIACYKRLTQTATGKLGITFIDAKTGRQIFSQSNLLGMTFYNRYSVFGVSWYHTDVPGIEQSIKEVIQNKSINPPDIEKKAIFPLKDKEKKKVKNIPAKAQNSKVEKNG